MVQNLLAKAPLGRQKVLLLGTSYPSVDKQMEEHGYDKSILLHKEASVEQAVECARRGILTEMDARDLARCVATEQVCEVDCYSASREIGAIYRDDRHVYGDFNNRNFCKSLKKAFGDDIQFSQVILDYYWMPSGWLVTRWARTLFQQTLPDLVKMKMLSISSTRKSARDKFEDGVVYLPFCAHVCKELVGGIKVLSQYYTISFVNKTELAGHSLWKGTMSIDANIMQHVLGKRLDQEEVYCTFKKKDIFENMEDSHVSKPAVMRILEAIEDYDNIRFIRLRPLRQHEGPSLFKGFDVEEGGFIGLNFDLIKEKKKQAELEAKRKKEEAKKEKLREQKEMERKEKELQKKLKQLEVEKRRKKQQQQQQQRAQKAKELEARRAAAKPQCVVSHVEEIPLGESKYKFFFPGPAINMKAYSEPGKGVAVKPIEPPEYPPPSRINVPPVGTFSINKPPEAPWEIRQRNQRLQEKLEQQRKQPVQKATEQGDSSSSSSRSLEAAKLAECTQIQEPTEQYLTHNHRLARDPEHRPAQIEFEDQRQTYLDVVIPRDDVVVPREEDLKIVSRKKVSADKRRPESRVLQGEALERAKEAGYAGSAVQYIYFPEDTYEVNAACKLLGMRMKSRGVEEIRSKVYDRRETTCFKVHANCLKTNPAELSDSEKILFERWKIRIARSTFGATSVQDGLLYLSRLERMDTILNWFKHNLNPLFDPNGYFARTLPKLVELWGDEGMLEAAEALELHIHEEAMSVLDEQAIKSDEWKYLNESILKWLQNETNVDAAEAEEFHEMKERLAHDGFKSDASLASEMADRILFLRQIFDWKRSAAPVVPEVVPDAIEVVEIVPEQELTPAQSEKVVLRENRKRPRDSGEHDVDFIENKLLRKQMETNVAAPKQVDAVCNKKISTTSNGILKVVDDRQKLQTERGDSITCRQFSPTIPLALVTPDDRANRTAGSSRKGKEVVHHRDARKLVGTFNTTTENAENFCNEACSKMGKQRSQTLYRILMYLQNPEDSFAKENPGIHHIARLIPSHTPIFQKAMMVEAIVHGLSEAHGQDWIHKSHHRGGFGLLIYELLRDIESLQRTPNDAYELKALMSGFIHEDFSQSQSAETKHRRLRATAHG